eukprot:2753894-Pleurochrysis_carterae.AAC.3
MPFSSAQEVFDLFQRQVARIASVDASHGDMVGVAKGEYCWIAPKASDLLRLTGEKVRHVQVRVVVVEVDDA